MGIYIESFIIKSMSQLNVFDIGEVFISKNFTVESGNKYYLLTTVGDMRKFVVHEESIPNKYQDIQNCTVIFKLTYETFDSVDEAYKTKATEKFKESIWLTNGVVNLKKTTKQLKLANLEWQ